jgi:hypothetical protein
MRYSSLLLAPLVVSSLATPLLERGESTWDVTDFSAYVAAHSITQMYGHVQLILQSFVSAHGLTALN